MDLKILVFSRDEIAIDFKGVADSINHACQRDRLQFRVSGLCQTYEKVIFPLEENFSENRFRYVLAPFSGTSDDEIEADLFTRWSSGFSTKGLIRLSESFFGLFEIVEST